jgi:hypothetical protein
MDKISGKRSYGRAFKERHGVERLSDEGRQVKELLGMAP